MRSLLRTWILYVLALYLLDQVFAWVGFREYRSLLLTASAFFLLNTIGNPLLKILWLPINIITLGLFSWVLSVIVVFLVVIFVPGFVIEGFSLARTTLFGFSIGPIALKLFWTYLLFSILLSWTIALLRWLLIEEK